MTQTTHPSPSLRRLPSNVLPNAFWSATRWLLLLFCLLTLIGQFAPWVNHKSAALVITGLDLGEYVKFLPAFRSGHLQLWREGFYLPFVAASLTLSLNAFRPERKYPWLLRPLLVLLAMVAALNLLPPAWDPGRLTTPEFRLQTFALLSCGLLAAFSPVLARLPRQLSTAIAVLISVAAVGYSLRNFFAILPHIQELYNHPLQAGWGMYSMSLGLIGLVLTLCGEMIQERR